MCAVSTDLAQQWGATIKARRVELNLTQKALAAAVDTTQQHLSFIERGAISPRDDLRQRLASALGLTVAELFRYPDEVTVP